MRKAYDKIRKEFIAVKQLKKVFKENKVESNECLEGIMLEDALLQAVEKVRVSNSEYNQHFLKYDGVFRDGDDQSALILKMESGCATLDNIMEAGKQISCAELLYAHRKMVEGFAVLQENGIGNRDVKAQNIILVEYPSIEGRFYYKISDFGIGCQLPKNRF